MDASPDNSPGPSVIGQRLRAYAQLMRLDRPIGILLLLWPTLWALWLAGEGRPQPLVLGVFVVGVLLMRSAGCVINDYADRDFDGHVQRTAGRPLPAGRVSSREALVLFVVLSLLAFALVLLMNPLTVWLALVGAALASVYPFMKRHTHFPQLVLGMAFGWAIPMAFAAQTGGLSKLAWLLFVINILWTTAYDTLYAMVDREDDLRIGVKSTAVWLGGADRAVVAALQVMTLLGLLLVGSSVGLHWPYYLGLAVAAALAAYQQWLIRDRDREACFRAFLNNNWFGAAVFLGLVGSYLLG